MLLYKGKDANREANTLPPNELFDANHTLFQNKALEKEEDQLYTLQYQYMVKEPSFDNFYGSAIKVIDDKLNDVNAKNFYKPKTLNGRVNILSFKLCHRYCIKCLEFGVTDNDQRCINCKEKYTYDYLAYVKQFTGNCVPENQMYDAQSKELKYCNTTTYKYVVTAATGYSKKCAEEYGLSNYANAVVNSGESFIYNKGAWSDWSGERNNYSDKYTVVDNFPIKAYGALDASSQDATEDVSDQEVSSQNVTVSDKSVTLKGKINAKTKKLASKSAKVSITKGCKTSGDGKLAYSKKSGNAKIKVTKDGKVYAVKGTKIGTYKISVKVEASATDLYSAASKVMNVTVKVRKK